MTCKGEIDNVTMALTDCTGVSWTPEKVTFVCVVGNWSVCATLLEISVIEDPESNGALAMNVLPPGPFSMT